MTDQPPESAQEAEGAEAEEPELPSYVIEGARSSRSRCKLCRQKIDAGVLRLGTLVEGRYGMGYMWDHLHCAAKRSFEKVEEAYAIRAWENAKELPDDIPPIEELATLKEQADQKAAEKKTVPYAELASSGRSKCKHSGEPIEKGAARVVLARQVEFGNQVRSAPINVLPEYVAAALAEPDNGTEIDGFEEALRENSTDLDEGALEAILEAIGPLR